MSPYSFKDIALYILLYFIEIMSLLSFPFYLFNAYILFIFICLFHTSLWVRCHRIEWIFVGFQANLKGDFYYSSTLLFTPFSSSRNEFTSSAAKLIILFREASILLLNHLQ